MLSQLAQITVDPTSTGLPGVADWNKYIGWIAWGSAMLCVTAIMAGGALWGWGHLGGNAHANHRGRLGVIGGIIGAVAIGLAVSLVKALTGFV